MYFLDRSGWPLELIKGRWFWNCVRVLIHARGIRRGSPQPGTSSYDNSCQMGPEEME